MCSNPLAVIYPIGWFLLATLFFFLGIQEPRNHWRITLSILHLTSIILVLATDPQTFEHFPPPAIPFVVGLTIHTTSILLVDKHVVELGSVPLSQRPRRLVLMWTNIRRLPDGPGPASSTEISAANRLFFASCRILRVLVLYLADRGISWLVTRAILLLGINIHDFAPDKQGLLPSLTPRDLGLRAITSVHWIWATYFGITSAHDIFAAISVALLRWNEPSGWPRLFGPISEAYSLRRFWGVFWHRLHVKPFAAYAPSFLDNPRDQSHRTTRKALHSLWIFILSAGCHVVVNYATIRRDTSKQELTFFLYNWVVCFFETVLCRTVTGTWLDLSTNGSISALWARRILGYVWVLAFFFCTVPAWRYPLVYDAVFG